MKKEYGIIGFPLGQSASPAFFNKKFANEGIDAEYIPFEIESIETDNYSLDHIIPVSKGGCTVEDNLQTLCWKCNRAKSNKMAN